MKKLRRHAGALMICAVLSLGIQTSAHAQAGRTPVTTTIPDINDPAFPPFWRIRFLEMWTEFYELDFLRYGLESTADFMTNIAIGAIDSARRVLNERQDCRELASGPRGDAREVLKTVRFNPADTRGGAVAEYYPFRDEIVFYPPFYDNPEIFAQMSLGRNRSFDETRARILLHELLHATGRLGDNHTLSEMTGSILSIKLPSLSGRFPYEAVDMLKPQQLNRGVSSVNSFTINRLINFKCFPK